MKSAKEVIDFAKKNNAVMVDLKFIDFLGTWQHFAVSISDLSEDMPVSYTHLRAHET